MHYVVKYNNTSVNALGPFLKNASQFKSIPYKLMDIVIITIDIIIVIIIVVISLSGGVAPVRIIRTISVMVISHDAKL